MKLNLTTWERETLADWVAEITTGNLRELTKAQDLIRKLELSDEEKKLVGWQLVPLQTGGSLPRWNDASHEFELEFTGDEWMKLVQAPEWGGWRMPRQAQVYLIALLIKIQESRAT